MKKKILIIHRTLNGGGAEKVLLNILRNIDRKKYNIDLFLLSKEGIYLEEIEKLVNIKNLFIGYDCKDYNKFYAFFKKITFKVMKLFPTIFSKFINYIFLREKYDKVVSFLEGYPLLIASNRKEKKIAWIHIDLKNIRLVSKKREKKALSKMNKIICVANDTRNSMLELYPELESKSEVIYNPIDSKEIKKKSLEKKITKEKDLLFIAVGRLSHQKGFDILIEACKLLKKNGIEKFQLIILGEGEERKKLEGMIKNYDLQENVILKGYVKNPYPYLNKADAVIISSRFEGFSLVAAESLVLEKTIISTKCNGPVELLNNGEYGILISEINSKSLADAMLKFIEKCPSFKFESAIDKFLLDNIMSKINGVFDEE